MWDANAQFGKWSVSLGENDKPGLFSPDTAGFSGIHGCASHGLAWVPLLGQPDQGSPPGTVEVASSGHLPEPFLPPVERYLFGLFHFPSQAVTAV